MLAIELDAVFGAAVISPAAVLDIAGAMRLHDDRLLFVQLQCGRHMRLKSDGIHSGLKTEEWCSDKSDYVHVQHLDSKVAPVS